jgi:SAM-dependent MidA family methyltransferase
MMTPTSITFAEYMDHALYGPGGYYASGQAQSGRAGDYFTAPDTGSVFGTLLAQIYLDWQRRLGWSEFQLVEAGAGEGALARSIRTAAPGLPYIAVERSPYRREKLAAIAPVVAGLEDLSPFSGCLFGNELLDAFPVHRVSVKNGKLCEAFIENGRVVWDIPSTPELYAYFERLDIELAEGYETEVNLAMATWFKEAAAKLLRGLLVLIDYGRPAHEYYAPERDRGTLRTFSRHRVGDDALIKPGQIDLTADVDFTSAALDAQAAGFKPLAFMEMGSFLLEGARQLKEPPRALQYLIHPDGLGAAFHVLVLGKDVPFTATDFPHNRIQRLGV